MIPASQLSQAQLESEIGALLTDLNNSRNDGGGVTRIAAVMAGKKYIERGGEKRVAEIIAAMRQRNTFSSWEARARRTSLWSATVAPLIRSLAETAVVMVVGAAVIYGVTAAIGAATSGAAATATSAGATGTASAPGISGAIAGLGETATAVSEIAAAGASVVGLVKPASSEAKSEVANVHAGTATPVSSASLLVIGILTALAVLT